jgi:hypothetical protein
MYWAGKFLLLSTKMKKQDDTKSALMAADWQAVFIYVK